MPPFLLISSRGGIADSGDPDPGDGAPDPDGGSTILFDTRAGGAEDFQVLTTHAQMVSQYGASSFGGGSAGFFETNVDGAGTNARGIQWADNDSEQEAYVGTESAGISPAPSSGWYTSFKCYLGKSPTGGGTGTEGVWTFGGSNAHHKLFLWMRIANNASQRIYLVVRPSETKFSIDSLSWSSPDWDVNLYDRSGEVLKVTCYFSPDDGIIKAWINDTQVLDATGQSFGANGLVDIQETRTMRLTYSTAIVQYMWDTVVWY